MAVGTQRCYWFGKTRLKLELGFYVATTLKQYVGDQQLKFWCIQNVGGLQKHENLAFCWFLTSFSAAARASGASRRPPQQTRTVLYSRDTVRVYIRYAYLYAVFYNPESVLRHRYRQGWRFLTLWEGFGVEEATWEPFSAFVLPEGRLNSVLVDYLSQNNLGELLRLAETLASKTKARD